MGCCDSHQLDRKELTLILAQTAKLSPKSCSSHEFKDVSLESRKESPTAAIAECPFPLHADPAQSFKYFLEGRGRVCKQETSADCSKDDTTVSRHLTRTLLLNLSQEDYSLSCKLRLETSLADLQHVSLCRNRPHHGDTWLSPPLTSPELTGSNLSSISLDEAPLDLSILDLTGIGDAE